MFALKNTPSRFTGRGWGMGPDLPMQNYIDIGKINVAEQNLSRNEAISRRLYIIEATPRISSTRSVV